MCHTNRSKVSHTYSYKKFQAAIAAVQGTTLSFKGEGNLTAIDVIAPLRFCGAKARAGGAERLRV
eukprot:6176806-Pleurochrysis_carterae.AAC.4